MNPAFKQTLLTTLEWVASLGVAAYFTLAAVPKIFDPVAFAKAITNFRFVLPVIGQDYVYPLAIVMPALELLAAIALVAPRWRRAGALICGVLLVLFMVMIGQAVARGLNIDCGCFGTGAVSKVLGQKVGLEKILENLTLLACCVFVFQRRANGVAGKRYALAEHARAWK